MRIPLRNVYYLLIYAWNRLEEAGILDAGQLPSTQLADLFARVLIGGTTHVLRRGLDRGYTLHEEAIAGVRGKLILGETVKRVLRRSGKAFCEFDELSADTLPNRLLKATFRTLLACNELDKNNRLQIADILRWLRDVKDVQVNSRDFRRIQLHRNNAFYGFLLDVCELIHANMLVDEQSGRTRFRDLIRDEKQMAGVFQTFVFNFLRREQNRFAVSSDELRWRDAKGDEESMQYLPVMQTDIVLSDAKRKIVIDTKYYTEALQSGRYRQTVHSANLYQMYAYLRNMQAANPDLNTEGMLLYPVAASAPTLEYELDGFRVRVRSLNLDQPWEEIHRDLLALVA